LPPRARIFVFITGAALVLEEETKKVKADTMKSCLATGAFVCILSTHCSAFAVRPSPAVLEKKTIRIPLFLSDRDENDEHKVSLNHQTDATFCKSTTSAEDDTPELPPKLFIAAAYLAFISFWPLLAYIRLNFDFDIDTFMNLRDMMDDPSYDPDTIVELPKLSPGEQLVDAFFGPPGF
jgi:hypothetical protein